MPHNFSTFVNEVYFCLNPFLPHLSIINMILLNLQYHTLAMATCDDTIDTETGIPCGIKQKSQLGTKLSFKHKQPW